MKHLQVNYEVKKENLDKAKEAVSEFVEQIKLNEPGTLLYNSYNEKLNEYAFVHIMRFKDADSELKHRTTGYVKLFVDKLYPLCEVEPKFTELNLIAAKN